MNTVEMMVTALASNLPNTGVSEMMILKYLIEGSMLYSSKNIRCQRKDPDGSALQWLGCKYKTSNPVHDDVQALTINTISLPGGPRPRVDFFTTERSPNRDLGISKTRFHINIMSR